MSCSSTSMLHWAKRLNAAMVHARRARQEAHTRWPTFLLWKTVVSLDNTVSTSIRVFQVPRGQTCMVTGRAAIAVAEANLQLAIAVVSKVYPMRSHTVSAEGGAARGALPA